MINLTLFPSQLQSVLKFLFNGKAVTILRYLKQAGRSKVVWLYYAIGDRCFATFISRADLAKGYYAWLNTIDLFNIDRQERKAIGRANWFLLHVGDPVFRVTPSNRANRMGVITEKQTSSSYLPVVFVDWGDGTPVWEQPEFLECF